MTAVRFMMDSIECTRGESPWNGFTASWDEEQRGMKVAAVVIDSSYERIDRLEIYGPSLLAIDRKARRVVANTKHFSDLTRIDATKIESKHVVGTVKNAALYKDARRFATFLLVSDLIHTFAHVGSTLNIVNENDTPGHYRAEIDGEHEYFTNQRNTSRVHFAIELEKTSGAVSVTPL